MAAVAWQPSGAAWRWMTRCAGNADGKLLISLSPLRRRPRFPPARSRASAAAGVGESARGCRLEADKIREESRLSNPRWLSSPLVSLPLREDLAVGRKRDASRRVSRIGSVDNFIASRSPSWHSLSEYNIQVRTTCKICNYPRVILERPRCLFQTTKLRTIGKILSTLSAFIWHRKLAKF